MFIRKKELKKLISRIEVLEAQVNGNTKALDFHWEKFIEHLNETKKSTAVNNSVLED